MGVGVGNAWTSVCVRVYGGQAPVIVGKEARAMLIITAVVRSRPARRAPEV